MWLDALAEKNEKNLAWVGLRWVGLFIAVAEEEGYLTERKL